MKTNLILIGVILLITSCTTAKRCSLKFPQVASYDSIYIQQLDTVKIILPGDTITNEIPIKCPDQDILIMENGKLLQSLKIVNGLLKQRLIIKPDTVTKFVTNTITKTNIVKVPEKIKYVPKFVKILAWLGGISIFLFVIWLLRKMKIIRV